MVELEERFGITVDEADFTAVRRVADLVEQISRPSALREPLTFVDWNRSAPARLVRRVALAGLILPITRLFARIQVSRARRY